ncbi:AraC family transcriptional regulator [Phenylobacterium aquaticum]|uniref:AraC family transcriptional regulator n=1 Tax=Phenylobacterium aquaticum TaxID=1763816 RepID=UPI001F5DAEE4|nr:helix-turn-helix domain-containing protein [Phenylobacterium aquaticum]MCI3132820.1 helix-turn-helix domain-containing protein [Phenylobacterium aquaticum]
MPAQTQVLELLIRGAAAGVFVLLGLTLIQGSRAPSRLAGALFCLAAAAHTLTQTGAAFQSLGPAMAPIWVLSVMGAGLFWAFALELFGDHARLSPWRFLPATVLLAIGVAATAAPPAAARVLWLLQNLAGAALLLHVLFVTWAGWRADLVETRRRLRGPLLGVAALYALIVVSVQSAELFSHPASQLSLLAAVSLLAMSMAGGIVFLRADALLFGPGAIRQPARQVDPQDQHLLGRLSEALDAQEVWRLEGLTIGGLADRIVAPEHHLRRLINEGLGYRNFVAFINERRIAAAKAMLADPAQARTTVASVAFEVGFGSLGPFNRAFREATGQTPTTWRKAAQVGWSIPQAD